MWRTTPKPTPDCERFYHKCATKVEDKILLVIECPLYDDIRNDNVVSLFKSEKGKRLYNFELYIS